MLIDGGFLQSKCWGCFQKKVKNRIFYYKNKKGSYLAIEHILPFGLKYFLVPRGPIVNADILEKKKQKEVILSSLLKKAKQKNVSWIRIEPQTFTDLKKFKINLANFNTTYKTNYHIVKSKKEHQPKQTLMVDLSKNEEIILKSFKSKTRYNIRLSQRKSVKFFSTKAKTAIEKFINLMQEMAQRNKIKNHPQNYYKKMIGVGIEGCLNNEVSKEKLCQSQIKLYLAQHDKDILAGAIVSYSGKVATYLHGASSNCKRNLMAPFGLHWKIIQEAKKNGYLYYDLGGTKLFKKGNKLIPKETSWFGITRFKIGFCPNCQPIDFPGGYDIILNKKKYLFYKLAQNIKDKLKKII